MGGMVEWEEIACQHGHKTHHTRRVNVDLSRPHAYEDYPQVPTHLWASFKMDVWEWTEYDSIMGEYCPAHDTVSQTISQAGIWEPRETILTLQVCSTADYGQWIYDMGSQLGWYTLLAATWAETHGLGITDFEADEENIRILSKSLEANNWAGHVTLQRGRIDKDSEVLLPRDVRFAKIDIEGAEDEAIRILWPTIEAGRLDHLLMEVSPVFADYYPQLVADIVDQGYRAYVLPPKDFPPHPIDKNIEEELSPWRLDTLARPMLLALVASWHQENVWFRREEASW